MEVKPIKLIVDTRVKGHRGRKSQIRLEGGVGIAFHAQCITGL